MSDPTPTDAEGIEDPLGPPGGLGDDLRVPPAETAPATETTVHGGDAPTAAVRPGPERPEASSSTAGGDGRADFSSSSMEDLLADLERTTAERDDYLDRLKRNQAEVENIRKRAAKQGADDAARASEALVERLLPVLDACDGAMSHGATEVEPVFAALLGTLEKEGLVRVDPQGETFDPNLHDAVMHEPAADDDDDGTVVSDVMRPGYTWKGRVVRPAMVKVRG